jgi:hypothetical protein
MKSAIGSNADSAICYTGYYREEYRLVEALV